MKLSEAMREKMLLSFELFPPKTEKSIDRSIFPVHTVPAAEMSVPTGKYAR